MGAQVVDYRVSTLVVLCKDCGNDVGLYPARHKCTPIDRPAMPTLPAQYKKSNSPGTLDLNSRNLSSHSMTSSPSSSSNESPQTPKWSPSRTPAVQENDESVYFNNFAVNLPETNEPSGKKLWGKVRQNDKWKQLSEKNEKPKQSGKLWGKLLQATQTMADKIPSRDDRGAESDEDDWEGETHVARVLREYYEKKHLPLPGWLFDDNMAVQRKKSTTNKGRNDQLDTLNVNTPMRTPSRRRLWEQDQDEKKISSRERERQELRQAAKDREDDHDDRYQNRHYEEDRYIQDKYPPKKNQDRYRDEDRYRQKEEDRHRYREEDKYHHKEDDRYRPREETRYQEDRYRSKEEDRYRSKDDYRQRDRERSYQREEERHRPRDEDRYHRSENHYKSSYAKEDDYRYNGRESPKPNRHYEEDRYNSSHTRPLSPPRPQQRSNSTSRQRTYEDSSDYQPIRSGRSIRGYKDAPRSTDRYESHDLDDYYSSGSSRKERRYVDTKREPSTRRYVNDTNYF